MKFNVKMFSRNELFFKEANSNSVNRIEIALSILNLKAKKVKAHKAPSSGEFLKFSFSFQHCNCNSMLKTVSKSDFRF